MEALIPVFVRVPKTGSTSVSKAIFGDIDQAHCPASDLPSGPQYFRFGFVRNPYTRCLSAFNWFRHRTTAKWTQPMRDLSFAEWVTQHLQDVPANSDAFDLQCKYLNAPVDFVGRYENLEADFAHVLRALNRPQAELPHLNTTVSNDLSEYTDAARAVVRDAYAADFEQFGY